MFFQFEPEQLYKLNLERVLHAHPQRWSNEVIQLARVFSTVAGCALPDNWVVWLDEAAGVHTDSAACAAAAAESRILRDMPEYQPMMAFRETAQFHLRAN